jgi:hypothetical protein
MHWRFAYIYTVVPISYRIYLCQKGNESLIADSVQCDVPFSTLTPHAEDIINKP